MHTSALEQPDKPQKRNFSVALYAFLWVAFVFTAVVFYLDEYKRVISRLELVPLRQAYTPVNKCILLHVDDEQCLLPRVAMPQVSCEASPEYEGRVVHIVRDKKTFDSYSENYRAPAL